jgi:hypothetical protein
MAAIDRQEDVVAAEPTFLTQKDERVDDNVSDLLQQMELVDRQLEDAELLCVVDDVQSIQKSTETDAIPTHTSACEEGAETRSVTSPVRLNNDKLPSSPGEDEFPTLDFPVSISIDELNTSQTSSILGIEPKNTARNSVAKSSIARSLCSVKGHSKLKLTPEEEERVSEILRQEDDCMANYILPTEEEMARETELDILLAELGYELSTDDDATPQNKRGDPVLRELANKRLLEQRENCIDKALRALLLEPLPRVIRILQETGLAGQESISCLSSIGDSVLTAPISEEKIRQLVEEVKQNLLDDNMTLADGESVRLLATSILNSEAAKTSLYSESLID